MIESLTKENLRTTKNSLSLSDVYFMERAEWLERGRKLHDQYVSAKPFPHIVIDNFFPKIIADRMAESFPTPEFEGFKQPDNEFQKNKLGRLQESGFKGLDPFMRHMLGELNSMAFLDFLEALTGIPGVIVDPHFNGGGLHQIMRDGKLAVHADFNRDERRKLDRRINVLIYLNSDWKEEYGGHLELWDLDMKKCEKRVLPIQNRCAIFSTTSTSWHGHPDPLNCPENRTRNSVAVYYYTAGREDGLSQPTHSTLWKERPNEKSAIDKTKRALKYFAKKILPPVVMRWLQRPMW